MGKGTTTSILKVSLMAMGAGCVLLFGGGFPLLGAPDIYRGGAMLVLAVAVAGLSLWGMARLCRGVGFRFALGALFSFLALIGLSMVFQYGAQACRFAATGGPMWLAAFGTACTAGAGCIFIGVFGYLAWRLMTRRLWLAAAHLSAALVIVGALIDYGAETRLMQQLPADGQSVLKSVRYDGETQELPFRLRINSFDITRYEGSERYALYSYDHAARRWQQQGSVQREGDELTCGGERWPLADFTTAPGMPTPYLLAGQGRVILKEEAPVKEYRAACQVTTWYKGREEKREEVLRVNEPIIAKGWQITLMSHSTAADGSPIVHLQLRDAPGRFWALCGMVGLMLCTACWCYLPERRKAQPEAGKEAAHA